MDTFKGQDNDVAANLCGDNNYAIVKVPHNLTNKFQPIDITVNKPAKYFISEKCNKWFAAKQREKLSSVDVTLKLSEVKPQHASASGRCLSI